MPRHHHTSQYHSPPLTDDEQAALQQLILLIGPLVARHPATALGNSLHGAQCIAAEHLRRNGINVDTALTRRQRRATMHDEEG